MQSRIQNNMLHDTSRPGFVVPICLWYGHQVGSVFDTNFCLLLPFGITSEGVSFAVTSPSLNYWISFSHKFSQFLAEVFHAPQHHGRTEVLMSDAHCDCGCFCRLFEPKPTAASQFQHTACKANFLRVSLYRATPFNLCSNFHVMAGHQLCVTCLSDVMTPTNNKAFQMQFLEPQWPR